MRKFKTESKKLLDLMINSIYTNKEIFLRELISNASDASDKLYMKSLTDGNVNVGKSDLDIVVSFDKDTRTLTVSDHGIGMNDADLEKNLGTIAHSDSSEVKAAQKAEQKAREAAKNAAKDDSGKGDSAESADDAKTTDSKDADATDSTSSDTTEVDQKAAEADSPDIIGQFGVGFYSAFMVASNVCVVSKKYGDDQAWAWESNGVEGYTISKAEKDEWGTDVILTIKDGSDYDHYLNEYGLRGIIKRYSNYVRYPIKMMVSHEVELPKPDDAGDDYKPQYKTEQKLEVINSMVPIWKKRKSEVKQEDYNEFYKTTFHDYADPLRTISFHAEGLLEYDVLLFIPSRMPSDLYSKEYKKGLQLYSSNVLIMDKCEELLPDEFNFVKGVVDSHDLNLNISRETLQHDSRLMAIARKISHRIQESLRQMRDKDREDYEKFFENFGRGIKYAIYSSFGAKKDQLADLLLFYSAKQKKMVSFDEYLKAEGDDAKSIYYAAGDTVKRLVSTPMVQTVLDKGHDVLLCTQDIDDFCMSAMRTYNDKDLKNVAGGDLGLDSQDDKDAAKEIEDKNGDLLKAMKESLGERVDSVNISTTLTDAPAALTAKGPVSLEMEKVMANMPGAEGVKSQRVLEINAKSPVFKSLTEAQEKGDADKVATYTDILYNQAMMLEGMPLEDPAKYVKEVNELMK